MTSLFRHWLLPHESNNHRARALHIDVLLFYVLAFTLFRVGITWTHRQFPEILGYATDIRVQKLLEDTNIKREASGLPIIKIDPELSRAAAEKAADMFAKNYWAHQSPDGKTPWDFIIKSGYNYVVAGENLAKNFNNSQGVVDAWMASPSHRDNLLKPQYRDVGFAVVNGVLNGEETTLVVQLFGTKAGQQNALPTQAENPPIKVTAGQKSQTVIPEIAHTTIRSSEQTMPLSPFIDVISKPMFNIASVTRGSAYIFIGFLLGVLAIDAWLAHKHRVVRVAGHNFAHILFLIAFIISLNMMLSGSVL